VNKRTIILLAGVVLTLAACGADNSSRTDAANTDKQLKQYQAVQPVPFYNWSQDRATFIQIYNAKNEARQTWTVFYSAAGTPQSMCPSVGYPIPANTQLTSPDQVTYYGSSGGAVIAQMEPNGLYSTTGSNGTYVLCVRPNGQNAAVYSESWVTAYPYEVKIENGAVVDLGVSTTVPITVQPPANVATPAPEPTK
jgi:hypothetical protein